MNTNLNIELSIDDLHSVSGGTGRPMMPVAAAQAGFELGGALFASVLPATGTLKGLTPRPPK